MGIYSANLAHYNFEIFLFVLKLVHKSLIIKEVIDNVSELHF